MKLRLAVALCLCGLCGCDSNAAQKAEAERVVHAVRELRNADNDQKAPRLAALRSTPCSEPAVVELKRECVAAYELYSTGLDSVRAVKKSLESDGGDPTSAATLLDAAEKDVKRGRELAEKCNRLEAEVSVRFKLP